MVEHNEQAVTQSANDALKEEKQAGKAETSAETYDVNVGCYNCGRASTVKINYGITVSTVLNEIVCSHCRCKGVARKLREYPVDLEGRCAISETMPMESDKQLHARS